MRPTLPAAVTALSLASAILACAASASAGEPRPAVAVRYGDLNTAAPAGAAVLLQRIDQATLVLCGGRPDLKAIADFQRFQACRAEMRQQALAQLAPSVVAMIANREAGR